MSGRVAWIHVAPVKGLAVEERDVVLLERSGVRENRRFHLIDDEGRLINGKRLGRLALVRAVWDQGTNDLELRFPEGEHVRAPVELGEPVTTVFYGRPVEGRLVEGPFAEALSSWAGEELRLVQPPEPGAALDRGSDGAVTLLSRAALGELAQAAGVPEVDARRFRMLFGIDGVAAHEEDEWIGRRVRIGDAVVEVQRRIGRCVVTKHDPESGERNLDTLDAIQAYRGEVPTEEPLPFGVCGTVVAPGRIRLGDAVTPG